MLKHKAVPLLRHCCFEAYWIRGRRVNVHDKQNTFHRRGSEPKDGGGGGADASCIFECCMFLSERIPVSYNHSLGLLCIWPGGGVKVQTEIRAELCGLLWPSLIAGNSRTGPAGRNGTEACHWTSIWGLLSHGNDAQRDVWLLVLTSRWQQGLTTRERLCSSVYLTFLQQHGWGHKTLVSSATKRRGCSSKQGSKYVFGMDAKCSGHKLWKKLGADILI